MDSNRDGFQEGPGGQDEVEQIQRRVQPVNEGSLKCVSGIGAGLKISKPHQLFDIPLQQCHNAFIDGCCIYGCPETFGNDYDGLEMLLFKFEKVIKQVLPQMDSEVHESCLQIADENTYSTNPKSFSDWIAVAQIWLGQYLKTYNSLLYQNEPTEFKAVKNLLDKNEYTPPITGQKIREYICNEFEPKRLNEP